MNKKNQSSKHQSEPNKIIRKISIVETIKTSHNSLFAISKNPPLKELHNVGKKNKIKN